MAELMDALVCVAPGKLELVRRPRVQAGPGEVLVRPRRIGICGTDYHIYEGKHPFLTYPRIMGHELAVEVVERPAGSNLQAGEIMVVNPYLSCGTCVACRQGKPNCCTRVRVLGVHSDGGMAELISVPPANLIHAEGLSPDACAAVEFLLVGAHAVRRAMVAPGDQTLVIGAGPIGLGVAMFARLAGAEVTVLDIDPERTAAALSIVGVAHGLVADDDVGAKINQVTRGDGFGCVFDATGNAASIEAGFDYVAHGGRYALVSVVQEAITFVDADFHRKEMSLLGSRNALDADFHRVIEAIRDGKVPLDRLVTHRTSLGEARNLLPVWAEQKSGLIKAVVEI